MNANIFEFVLKRLDRRTPAWAEIARATGVPYNTLKKIATRTTPNPGVRHVQTLADYFTSRENSFIEQPPEQPPVSTVNMTHTAIKNVEAITAAEEPLREAEPWDGVAEGRRDVAPLDSKTKRHKLEKPVAPLMSAESVFNADWLPNQPAAKQQDAGDAGQGL